MGLSLLPGCARALQQADVEEIAMGKGKRGQGGTGVAIITTRHRPRAERYAMGKALRKKCPREAHSKWKAPRDRLDPVQVVLEADKGRLTELLPLRHGRMVMSPFTFYRGAALNMAMDLASTPNTGVRVQCCGDAHLGNFRGFATPERNVILAINDLDETLPAPWEWDVKRLAASIVIACRDNGMSESTAKEVVLKCVKSYREHMTELSQMGSLDLWYLAQEWEAIVAGIMDPAIRRRALRRLAKASETSIAEDVFPKLTKMSGGRPVIKEQRPTIFHMEWQRPGEISRRVLKTLSIYLESLTPATRVLLDHYRIKDLAIKVVGVGSVGTRCWIVLLADGAGDPLFLQVKEARASVLEAYAGKSVYANHGQRVVNGHRLMQPASDIFLGWTEGAHGHEYYVRQLRDVKIKLAIEKLNKDEMAIFADCCGQSLAISHARSGDPSLISGYLGKSDAFDEALANFAVAYADQTEADHALLKQAVRSGKVKTAMEESN
jgi:uncharacterized protein (DUF2252 family)